MPERVSRSRILQGFEGQGKEREGYCSGEPTRQMCASDAWTRGIWTRGRGPEPSICRWYLKPVETRERKEGRLGKMR